MRLLSAFPLLVIVVLAYNAIMMFTAIPLEQVAFSIGMMSGARFTLNWGDCLILAGLFFLFIEVLKAARTGSATILDHILSTAVFIGALVEFLMVADAGTSTFFLITVICLVDVVAGYSVSIRSARRDFTVGAGPQI